MRNKNNNTKSPSLNHAFRLVWSDAQQMFIAVAENVKSHGKPSARVSALATAVAGALLALSGATVSAAEQCSSSVSGSTVTLGAGDSCKLPAGATITPGTDAAAVVVPGGVAADSIDIAGTVTGTGTGSGTKGALILEDGASLANGLHIQASGQVIGSGAVAGFTGDPAIMLYGGTINNGFINAGTISGNGTQNNGIMVGTLGAQALTINGGFLNRATGLITNGSPTGYGGALQFNSVGSSFHTINGNFQNDGRIIGGNRRAVELHNVNINGNIINSSGATISGADGLLLEGDGLVDATVSGNFDNYGLIQGLNGYGLSVDGSQINGRLLNAAGAQISGADEGLLLSGATINGGIINQGTISGNENGIFVDDDSTANITNSGLIHGGEAGIHLSISELTGGITNQAGGLISGNTKGGIWLYEEGIISGSVNNAGTIRGISAPGIFLSSESSIGGITNSGLIEGLAGPGILISSESHVGSLVNQRSGIIRGSSHGIHLYDYGAITDGFSNAGLIDGLAGAGVFLESSAHMTSPLVNEAGGIIRGSTYGIHLNNNAYLSNGLINNGTISGSTNNAILLSGTSTLSGDLVNNGLISGGGANRSAIMVDNSTISGNIINQAGGIIAGGRRGVIIQSLSTITGGLINSGTISGDNAAIIIESGATLTDGIVIAGNDTARFIGAVYAPDSTVKIASGATYTMQGDELFTLNGSSPGFINEGTLGLKAVSNSGYTGTIDGNYSQGAGTTFRFDLADAVTYGRLNVTGNAELANGSIIDVRLNGTPGSSIDAVLVAGGILTTDPSQLTVQDNSAFYNFQASTARNAQELDLITVKDSNGLTDIAAAGRNPGVRGVAGALQSMFNTGIPAGMQPVFDRLVSLDAGELDTAMQQMLPAIQGATAQAGLNALRSMNKIIQSRIESNQGLSSGDVAIDQYLWLRGFGSWANQGSNDGVPGFDSNTQGFVIGADRPINERVRAGVAFTYAKTDIHDNSAVSSSSVDVDTYELVGYGSYNLDAFTDINYQLDVGQHQADSRRDAFGGGVAKADFDSLALHGSLGIGRVLPFSEQTNLTPSLRMDYTHMKTDGYKEHGAALEGLNLDVDSSTIEELLLSSDLKLAHQFDDNNRLVANVTVGYDFINEDVQSSSAFVGGGPVFQTEGLDPSPWLWRTGLGWLHDNQKGVELSLRYDHEGRSSDYRNDTLSARVRWEF